MLCALLLFTTPLDVSWEDCYLGKSTITWINILHKPSDCISDLWPSQSSLPSFGSSGRSLVFSRFSLSVLCSFAMIELQINPWGICRLTFSSSFFFFFVFTYSMSFHYAFLKTSELKFFLCVHSTFLWTIFLHAIKNPWFCTFYK